VPATDSAKAVIFWYLATSYWVVDDIGQMRHVCKTLGLLLLLLLAQQGAVVHELGHFSRVSAAAGLQADSSGTAEKPCAQCGVFAQVFTPAVSHSFDVTLLHRAAPDLGSKLQFSAPAAAVPRARSRGPPSSS
jgi:hypothetical protein